MDKEPVALKDLTASLNAFANEYRGVQKRTASKWEDDKVELYVRRIREGSIIAELAPLVPAGLALVENANTMLEFCEHLREGVNFLRGKVSRWRTGEKKSAENIVRIVEPIAREGSTQLVIQAPINLSNSSFNITITTNDAREIKETAKAYIQSLEAPSTGVVDKVRLFWYQARNEKASTAGDRAIIPELSEKPVKVMFSTDSIKARMLDDEANPFKKEYIVDVVVDSKGVQPKLYRITKVHGANRR